MYKKLLTVAFFSFALSALSFGQCVPNTTITTVGYYPDSATGLPPAYVGVLYNTVVQIKCPTDTVVSPFGNIHINYIKLDSVLLDSVNPATGKHLPLPAGFTYTTSPTNGQFTNPASPSKVGANGCILLAGTAVTGQLAGMNGKNNGKYPLIVFYHSNVTVPVVGVTNQNGTNRYYHITVLPASAAGIIENENESFTVLPNSPNPADSYTDIRYWTPNTENVEFHVYNVLGSMITSKMIHSDKGSNKYTFDTSSLTPGIYLYSLKSGDKTVSRRMIVSAH
jgi:hypothetical protein